MTFCLSMQYLYGPSVKMNIKTFSCLDHRGLYIANLSTDFSYTKTQMKLKNLDIITKESKIKADLFLDYKISDFSDFNDKVKFNQKTIPLLIFSFNIIWYS